MQSAQGFSREFFLLPLFIRDTALLAIKGRVRNTGGKPWDNQLEPEDKEFRIGIRIYSDNDYFSPVYEGRCYFNNRCIQPGEYVDFNSVISTVKFPAGKCLLKINILKEHCFWFDDLGIASDTLHFQLPESLCDKQSSGHSLGGINSKKGTSILFVLPNLPRYDKSSGENRLFEILKLFKAHKYKVTLLVENLLIADDDKKYYKDIKHLGFKYFNNPYDFFIGFKNEQYSICIIAWYNLAIRYIDIFRSIFPHAKIIVDSVDVHWVRYARGTKAGEVSNFPLESEKNKEKLVYRNADIVWAVTETDKNAVLKEIPDCKIKIVSNIHRKYKKYVTNPNKNSGIIFIGGFKHPPNEGAAIWGYEICRKLRERIDIPFVYYILGDSPSVQMMSLHDGKNTIVTGFVPELYEYYKKSRIMLASIKHGSGIKGKICHAICSGIPVITTTIGNEGLELGHGKEAFIANTTEEFLSALIKVFSGQVDLKEMNKKALRKVLNITSAKKNWQAIEDSILD